jgi:hypothetical protein
LKIRREIRDNNYKNVLKYIQEGIKKKSFNNVQPVRQNQRRVGKDADLSWITHKLQKYTTGEWEVMHDEKLDPLLAQFKVILLQNKSG